MKFVFYNRIFLFGFLIGHGKLFSHGGVSRGCGRNESHAIHGPSANLISSNG